ncbi:MAG: hypothetical protein C4527_20400 [Candidatus Omnitrophota bacterium]|nr:MAG: hypothetical protein C4527_20400 [Candidatus Omnitrophota bacterium]
MQFLSELAGLFREVFFTGVKNPAHAGRTSVPACVARQARTLALPTRRTTVIYILHDDQLIMWIHMKIRMFFLRLKQNRLRDARLPF